jgi:hypothetical protein
LPSGVVCDAAAPTTLVPNTLTNAKIAKPWDSTLIEHIHHPILNEEITVNMTFVMFSLSIQGV